MPTALVATMKTKPGRRDQLIAALHGLAESARAEPGTLLYMIHTAKDPETVVMYELYTDRDALRAHGATDAMAAAVAGPFAETLAEPPSLVVAELQGGITPALPGWSSH